MDLGPREGLNTPPFFSLLGLVSLRTLVVWYGASECLGYGSNVPALQPPTWREGGRGEEGERRERGRDGQKEGEREEGREMGEGGERNRRENYKDDVH